MQCGALFYCLSLPGTILMSSFICPVVQAFYLSIISPHHCYRQPQVMMTIMRKNVDAKRFQDDLVGDEQSSPDLFAACAFVHMAEISQREALSLRIMRTT